jgi:hypothetical protein
MISAIKALYIFIAPANKNSKNNSYSDRKCWLCDFLLVR